MADLKNKSEDYWKKKLTPRQYRILRQKGTEAPFTGALLKNKEKGMYKCAACGQELFSSDSKFLSNSVNAGWPSFSDVLSQGHVELKDDLSVGMKRVEVVCKNCGSHLGHLFDDPSSPTGRDYCINSCALDFKAEK